jgi:hypothetical protein
MPVPGRRHDRHRISRRALTFLLIVATAVVFGRIVTHEFVGWDDPDTIAVNARLRPPSWQGVAWYWTHPAHGLYVPLTYSAWSALATVAQTRTAQASIELNPWLFHAASVLVHICCAATVMDVLRRLVGPNHDAAAFFGAMLFALHPLQVESVAWASGFKDVLCGLLSMLAIRSYVIYAQRERVAHYVVALALLLLAMLAKPAAIVVPAILGTIDLLVLRRPLPRVARAVLPMMVIVVPFAILARVVQVTHSSTHTPLWTRLLIAMDSLAFYMRKLLFPWPLTVMYGRTPTAAVSSGAIYYTWIAPAVVGAALLVARRKLPVLVAGAAVVVIGLSPVLGLTNFMMQAHSTVADHYMYLPMFGVSLAGAWGVARWESRGLRLICGIALLLLGLLSLLQAGYWRNSITLFEHAVAVTPENDDAINGLGNALAHAGRFPEAIARFERAAQINPQNRWTRELLTQALVFAARFEDALPHGHEALRLAAIEGETDTAQVRLLLGRALANLGRFQEAEEHLSDAARQQPHDKGLAAELDAVRRRPR